MSGMNGTVLSCRTEPFFACFGAATQKAKIPEKCVGKDCWKRKPTHGRSNNIIPRRSNTRDTLNFWPHEKEWCCTSRPVVFIGPKITAGPGIGCRSENSGQPYKSCYY